MKLTLIFLSICVAVSQQQYFHPRIMSHPWMSPFAQHPMYFNNYMVKSNAESYYISVIVYEEFSFMFMMLGFPPGPRKHVC